MARLAEPLDLTLVSVRSIPGLTPEDVEELRALEVVNVQSLMDEMDAHGGRLHELSNHRATIEVKQAKRIGDALISYESIPKAWRDNWELHGLATPLVESAVEVVDPVAPWYDRGVIGWLLGK